MWPIIADLAHPTSCPMNKEARFVNLNTRIHREHGLIKHADFYNPQYNLESSAYKNVQFLTFIFEHKTSFAPLYTHDKR
jgi:hypothetical protein